MHIIIGLLTAIGSVLWVLYRLQHSGVNLNDFNPFYWWRRRQWQQKVRAKPLHALEKPMEAAACLIVGVAKLEGELSREQKAHIIGLFVSEFRIDERAAQDLFAGSAFLLGSTLDVTAEVPAILAPCRDKFSPETTQSLLAMLREVATLEHAATDDQEALIQAVAKVFETQGSAREWR